MYANPTAMTMSQELKTALMSQNVPGAGAVVPDAGPGNQGFAPGSASRGLTTEQR